jgi:plastocyanin
MLLLIAAGLTGLLVSVMVAAPAQAGSTRVSISDFQWSKNPEIDLGESVTWDWIGPDTQHSVTGQAPNATQFNSDPGPVNPHALGHTFKATFDLPGVYNFVCKLHASVRGTVTVSSNPGDPFSDPGPQPPLKLDLLPPNLQSVFLTRSRFADHGKGTGLAFQSNERGVASADYYRLVTRGSGASKRTIRQFAGFRTWDMFIGNNLVNFAGKSEGFSAQPGRYVALFFATDKSANSTPEYRLPFEIVRSKRR